jgi:phage shock protein PspC (stress-responsive transcriptional regulator)
MNKVITINLNGNAYQLEEAGYDALRVYLDGAALRLAQNPDREEIIADIEQAFADKFRAVLGAYKTVVETKDVLRTIAEMGPVQDNESGAEETTSSASSQKFAENETGASGQPRQAKSQTRTNAGDTYTGPARRLYKIPEGAMVAGVLNGLAAYLGMDVVAIRLGFAVIAILFGILALFVHWFFFLPFGLYAAFAVALPAAVTPEERAAARGDPSTAQEYIRRAKQGYYEGLKTFAATAGNKEWKAKFKQDMRAHHHWGAARPMGPVPYQGNLVFPAFILPLFGLCEFLLVLGSMIAIFLLVSEGNIAGIALPTGVPLWVGAVAVLVVFNIVTWPLKAYRHSVHLRATGEPYYCFQPNFFGSLIWLSALVAAVWLGDHYIPQVHEFILTLPAKAHLAEDWMKQWWSHR